MILDVFGFMGVACYVLGYGLLQTGILNGNGYIYAFFNMFGAAFTLISLTGAFNLWSALIQLFFLTFSVIGTIRVFIQTRNLRFSDEEKALLSAKFQSLSLLAGRKLLNHGEWINLQKGDAITTQGEQVRGLYFLAEGSANVQVDGIEITQIGAGEFIGELTCMSEDPASATVTAAQAGRAFLLGRAALSNLSTIDTEIASSLTVGMHGDVSSKLKRANQVKVEGQNGARGAAASAA